MNDPTDCYKMAPTFLHKKGEDPQLFKTQEGVDAAWEDGWYGPQWLNKGKPLLGDEEFEVAFETKAGLVKAAASDPRYKGFKPNLKHTVEGLMDDIILFEVKAGLRGDDGDE